MEPTIDKNELSDFLSSAGCCKMCVLRFLKPWMDDFLNVEDSLKKVRNFKKLTFLIYYFNQQKTTEHVDKKLKSNPCVTCFGICDFIEELLQKIRTDDRLQLYDVNKFLTSFSLPLSLNLAQLQMWLALLEKFPDHIDERKVPDISVKDALKHTVNERLARELGKEFHVDGLMISITFVHDDEKNLFGKLAAAIPERMREWNGRK